MSLLTQEQRDNITDNIGYADALLEKHPPRPRGERLDTLRRMLEIYKRDTDLLLAALDAATAERDALKSIVMTEDTCGGLPRFDGTRLPIECVARPILESGVTVAEQVEDHEITEAQVNAAVHWWQAVGYQLARMFEQRYPKVARLKAERDALAARVRELEARRCATCKHYDANGECMGGGGCGHPSPDFGCIEWRPRP